jgi:tetratricopeptide (TPR) repeat protein
MNGNTDHEPWLSQESIAHVFVASDPERTRTSIEAILATSSLLKGQRLEWETIRARTFSLQMNLEEAFAVLWRVEQRLDGSSMAARIRWRLERGRTHLSADDRPAAREDFHCAYQEAVAAEHEYLAVDALHMLGIAHDGKDALRWNELAIARIHASTDEAVKTWLGPLLNNTAWTYFDLGEYGRARDLFAMDVTNRLERGRAGEARTARYSLARTYRAMGDVATALLMQQTVATEIAACNAAPDGYVEEEIGECLLELGRPDESRPHFQKAYEILAQDSWLRRHQPERIERLRVVSSMDDSQS